MCEIGSHFEMVVLTSSPFRFQMPPQGLKLFDPAGGEVIPCGQDHLAVLLKPFNFVTLFCVCRINLSGATNKGLSLEGFKAEMGMR